MSAFVVCTRAASIGFALALMVAFAGALVQLFPAAPALASLGLLRTLALPLASLALELGVLAGVPLGFALGVAQSGESWRTLGRLLLIPAVLAAVLLTTARQVDLKDDSPGNVVERLIAAARQSCASGTGEVPVPVVNVTLRCAQGRLTGAAPLGKGSFSARELVPSADLSRLAFADLELTLPASKSVPKVQLRAKQAVVRGLKPWGRGRSASSALRAFAAWLAVCVASASAGLVVARGGRSRALFIGLGSGVACALSALALDRAGVELWVLALLPLAGLYGALLAQIAWDLARELMAHLETIPLRRRRAIARGAGGW